MEISGDSVESSLMMAFANRWRKGLGGLRQVARRKRISSRNDELRNRGNTLHFWVAAEREFAIHEGPNKVGWLGSPNIVDQLEKLQLSDMMLGGDGV